MADSSLRRVADGVVNEQAGGQLPSGPSGGAAAYDPVALACPRLTDSQSGEAFGHEQRLLPTTELQLLADEIRAAAVVTNASLPWAVYEARLRLVADEARVEFRPGAVDDVAALADLQFRAPSKEAVSMAGSAAAAKRFRSRLLTRSLTDGKAEVIVLELDGRPVGFAELSLGGDIPSLGIVARCAIASMGPLGVLRGGWRALARSAVDIKPPEGVHLVELHVAPEHRNAGLGGRLLAEVERVARQRHAPNLTLTTTIDNPARRLYERSGLQVEAEKRHRRYEAITGSPGRVLMVKPLAS